MGDISEFSSSNSSTDEELFNDLLSSDEEYLVNNVNIKNEKPKNHTFFEVIPFFTEKEFLENFRINRELCHEISERFMNSHYFNYQSGKNGKLDSYQQVLIYLWFIGHKTTCFREVSDRFDIAVSTLFRIIRKLTYFLSDLSTEVIKWPSNDEKSVIESNFTRNGFPGAIGVISTSHVRIVKPADDPKSYLYKETYYSIQFQIVCDHRREIRDIFVGLPGSLSDSSVFSASSLSTTLQEKCDPFFILGDSCYPCLNNLLTPFKDYGNLTRRQRNYNLKLEKNRYLARLCIGVLKQKFRQLHHVRLKNVPNVIHFIKACCVLYNLSLDDDFVHEAEGGTASDRNIEDVYREAGEIETEETGDNWNGIQRRNDVANTLPIY